MMLWVFGGNWIIYIWELIGEDFISVTLRKNCPYLELLWSAFSRIRTVYWEIRSISPYSVRMLENVD